MHTLPDDTNLANAVTAQGGSAPRDRLHGAPRTEAALDDVSHLMRELAIRYDGRYYQCNGFRYDYLADAVSYARLSRRWPVTCVARGEVGASV